LLITALIIFPALSAMRLFKNFKAVVVCSAILSVVCAVLGLCLSILFETPTGATIVITDIFAFLIFWLLGKLLKRS
jgi:zinc transport system permease protein